MIIAILLIISTVLASLAFCKIEKELQALFLSNSFCQIPFRRETLNDILKRQVFIKNEVFRETVKRLSHDPAVLDSMLIVTIKKNGRLLASFLDSPNSPLCRSFANNSQSPFGKLRNSVLNKKAPSQEITSPKKISDFLDVFFNSKEVSDEFRTLFMQNETIRNFSQPAPWSFWGSFNFLQLNQARQQPASPHTLAREVEEMLPAYVKFYCDFLELIPDSTPQQFMDFLVAIGEGSIGINGIAREHLLSPSGVSSRFMAENYRSLVDEESVQLFAKRYIKMFFEPAHQRQLIEVAKKFSTKDKLKAAFISVGESIQNKAITDTVNDNYGYWFRHFLLQQMSLNKTFAEVSDVEILSSLSLYEFTRSEEASGKKQKDSVKVEIRKTVDFVEISSLFSKIFKSKERGDAFVFYINVCTKPNFVADVCPPACMAELPIMTRIHLVVDFIVEPFRGKSPAEVRAVLLQRYKQASNVDCNLEDPLGRFFTPEELVQTNKSFQEILESFIQVLEGVK